MGTAFWIRRFALVFVVATVIITLAQLVKGQEAVSSVQEGLAWGLISAAIFVAGRRFQIRRGQHCALCQDTPEMAGGEPMTSRRDAI